MNANASDFKEAGAIADAYLKNKNETYLMLSVNTEPYKTSFTMVKLPYGEDVMLLYAIDSNQAAERPCGDMKYAGFYSLKNGQAYDIREPLDRFIGFSRRFVHESDLKKSLTAAIQNAVADHIESKIMEHSGMNTGVTDAEAAEAAIEAFGKKQAKVSFAQRIKIEDYYISKQNLVDFIADPDALLVKKVEFHIHGHEEELARLWFAVCSAQKILDELNAKEAGGGLANE